MTDAESFLLASWIERARKATEALTRYGYVIAANGEWVLSDRAIARLAHRPTPHAGARPRASMEDHLDKLSRQLLQPVDQCARVCAGLPPKVSEPAAKPNGYVYGIPVPLPRPPIDYDTKS